MPTHPIHQNLIIRRVVLLPVFVFALLMLWYLVVFPNLPWNGSEVCYDTFGLGGGVSPGCVWESIIKLDPSSLQVLSGIAAVVAIPLVWIVPWLHRFPFGAVGGMIASGVVVSLVVNGLIVPAIFTAEEISPNRQEYYPYIFVAIVVAIALALTLRLTRDAPFEETPKTDLTPN